MKLNDFTVDMMGQADWKSNIQDEISYRKSTIEGNKYDEVTVARMKAELETYELALKYDINYIFYYNSYWKIDALSEIEEAKYNSFLGLDRQENNKTIEERIELLEKNDYAGYMDLNKKEAKERLDKKTMSTEEYNDTIYMIDLYTKYGINKEPIENLQDWKKSLCSDIETIKGTLRTGINKKTGKLLKIEEIEKLQNDLKIAEYRLENNIPTLDGILSARVMYDATAPEFSMIMVALLMVIIAGSSISTEVSKGTIKFLLFTPNKRWKVLLSKIISAVLILLVLTIGLSLISNIIGNIFFEEAGTVYVYVQNGQTHSIPNLLYTVLYFLASSIDILVYMMFAFMLSTLTRNTALSVGVSIACYIGSGIVMNILNLYITADWIKYIPFNNLGIADKIFSNNISFSTMQMTSELLSKVTIGFSISVLIVCVILMIVSMFDSFNKRDIA